MNKNYWPKRKTIRLKEYDYSHPGFYFITICTHKRECLFGSVIDSIMMINEMGNIVQDVWNRLPDSYANIILDRFVIMPNHVHGIIVLQDPQTGAASSAPTTKAGATITLGHILRRFKSVSAIAINRYLRREGQPLWQRNYHEHVIRNEAAYLKISEYIETNPQKWTEDIYYV